MQLGRGSWCHGLVMLFSLLTVIPLLKSWTIQFNSCYQREGPSCLRLYASLFRETHQLHHFIITDGPAPLLWRFTPEITVGGQDQDMKCKTIRDVSLSSIAADYRLQIGDIAFDDGGIHLINIVLVWSYTNVHPWIFNIYLLAIPLIFAPKCDALQCLHDKYGTNSNPFCILLPDGQHEDYPRSHDSNFVNSNSSCAASHSKWVLAYQSLILFEI